jgi:hypothetical protein
VGRFLWREDASVICNCRWPSPAQSFSGPRLLGLATLIYCLRFESSLFVASYDSQGYGGGIRPRLLTGVDWLQLGWCRYITPWPGPRRPFPTVPVLLLVDSLRGDMLISRSLPSNGSTRYNINQGSLCPRRYLYQTPPEYESRVLQLDQPAGPRSPHVALVQVVIRFC